MNRGPALTAATAAAAALFLSACAQSPLSATAGVSDHCVAALGRMVRQRDAVEVWTKKVTSSTAAGRSVRVVDMDVTIASERLTMQCVYPRGTELNASSIRIGARRLTPGQLAAVNKAVRENQDIGAQVHKRLPSPPDVGPFSFSPETTRKK